MFCPAASIQEPLMRHRATPRLSEARASGLSTGARHSSPSEGRVHLFRGRLVVGGGAVGKSCVCLNMSLKKNKSEVAAVEGSGAC